MKKIIYVCPLSRFEETLALSGAKRVISLLSNDGPFEPPQGISADNHLHLQFNDITADRAGLTSPSKQHVLSLIEFARQWNWSTPLLIHCWAGISRSPAAAAIIALALEPSFNDQQLAKKMRGLSAEITPNIKMIEIADDFLNREGLFLSAFRAIGRGKDAFEGTVFRLELD